MSTLGSVQREDFLSTLEGAQYIVEYHQYTGGCSVHRVFHKNSMVLSTIFPILIMVSLYNQRRHYARYK